MLPDTISFIRGRHEIAEIRIPGEWVNRQVDYWHEMGRRFQTDKIAPIHQDLINLRNLIEQSPASEQIPDITQQVQINELFDRRPFFFTADSHMGRIVERYVQEHGLSGIQPWFEGFLFGALAMEHSTAPAVSSSGHFLWGAAVGTSARFYEIRGVSKNFFAVAERAEMIPAIIQRLSAIEASNERIRNLSETGKDIIAELNAFKEEAEKCQTAIQADLALARAQVKNIEFGEATKFWNEKATSHRKSAKILNLVFYFGGAAIIACLAYLFISYGDTLFSATISIGQAVGHAAFIGSTLGIGVWMLRHLLRTARMHEHLRVDAEERVTMIRTYLAMLASIPNQVEIGPVLATLYRPSPTGMVNDEHEPVLVFDTLLKILQPTRPPVGP